MKAFSTKTMSRMKALLLTLYYPFIAAILIQSIGVVIVLIGDGLDVVESLSSKIGNSLDLMGVEVAKVSMPF